MRWSIRMVLSLAVVFWGLSISGRPATAQQQAKSVAPAKAAAPPIDPDGSRMQLLLAKWAKQSTQLRSLDVKIRRIDMSSKWDDEEYEGRAMFKSPNQAWLDFQKVVVTEGKPNQLVPHERIVCTGKQVWQYRSDTHQVFVHDLGLQQRQRALQEGPLPFLFNFQADEARKRYQMKLISEDPKSYVISVLPLLPIDKESFSAAWVELDKTMLLPTQIVLLDPEGKSKKRFVMSGIKPNAPVMAENFQGQKLGPPWKILYNKEEGQAAPAPAVAPAEAPRTGDARQPQAPQRRGVLGSKVR
ncbi:outer-membrane lipoprotein carrier protein LolA [Singulisphaera acidiphila]|uniref:Outer membrane lipoprotein-sorting protein n=1 Tax=Singulisphaera acidiphila (strain ATCC BAA-1392 / DSM 18658 / VKM B-2454 / MOB10) TaxID=886293 RepID=L0DAU6_SINAD|nr:outer-membrane lipoprotein carrier protein LolA [Singulisphaera acidiphila]AGA25796.1 outer membrane lipoprotein-sorting protein [Singulisphaera acidiphila DSM 18658]